MRQIVVISGKGGTGKTVLTGSFAALAKNKVMADCDVDAADLHLLLAPQVMERHDFRSGSTAVIDRDKCVVCGKCMQVCRFSALRVFLPSGECAKREVFVDPVACEGCAFCSFACPRGAITMEENLSGEWFISETRFGRMVHAKLGVAEENSGKLVSLVRGQARELAEKSGCDWVIVDGAPGIGCPVIASLSGVDLAVVVTEPTLSGLHDADRVMQVAGYFGIKTGLAINKYDLNAEMSKKIEEYCKNKNIPVLGKIAFDENVVKSMVEGKTVIEFTNNDTAQTIKGIWKRIEKELS